MKQGGKAKKLWWKIRLVTGVVLLPVGFVFLLTVDDTHVTLCMIGAVLYAAGLLLSLRKKQTVFGAGLTAFGAALIIFYTILTNSTMLALEWLTEGTYGSFSSVSSIATWWYHFLINGAVLVGFITGVIRQRALWVGLYSAMIAGFTMPLLVLWGWRTVIFDPPQAVALYVGMGLTLFAADAYTRFTWFKNKKRGEPLNHLLMTVVWLYAGVSLFIALWSLV